MKKVYLFTTPNCAYCPSAKEHLTNIGAEFELIDASTNIELRAKYRVMSAPMLVIDEDGNVKKYVGEDIKKLNNV